MSARVVNFADGFTSATTPEGSEGVLETYEIQNTVIDTTIATYPNTEYKTVISSYELVRSTSLGSFKQSGSMTFTYDSGTWSITYGNYTGDDLLVDAVINLEQISLAFVGDELQYTSGGMSGTGYIGTLKLSSVRFK